MSSFESVLPDLKLGKNISRDSWLKFGIYLSPIVQTGGVFNIPITLRVDTISEDGSRPWIPTVDDLLAKDWTVV
jgi:hypothetical protein